MKTLFCLFSLCLAMSFSTQDTEANDARGQGTVLFNQKTGNIEIDQGAKALKAPDAHKYQWFKDGVALRGQTSPYISVTKGGNYRVKMWDEVGNVTESKATIAVTATGKVIKIYTIGDSTMATFAPSAYPLTGWGAVFQYFFDSNSVEIINKGVPSMSTKTFYTNYWATVKAVLASGDYVFIQFGHNDLHYNIGVDAYKQYLTMYVNEIRAKGAIPIFVTSMIKNVWTNGVVSTTSISPYPETMRQMAVSLKVPLIDLNAKSATLIQSLGKDYATWCIYNYLPADGTYVNYPTGNSDATHFQESGAIEMARLVLQGLKESSDVTLKALVPFLRPVYELSISANPKSSARVVTRTQSFPEGITVTLRTVPTASSVFISWDNAIKKNISNKQITWFTMGASKSSYTALYKGYIITDVEGEPLLESQVAISSNPFQETFRISVSGSFEYVLYDMEGEEMESGKAENTALLGGGLPVGLYVLKIHNQQGTKLLKVIKN
jgi:lysophospholipase L1-like esterase